MLAATRRRGVKTALDSRPRLTEAQWETWHLFATLNAVSDGIRPDDIARHMDEVGILEPRRRRRVYKGVWALHLERTAVLSEEAAARKAREAARVPAPKSAR